MHLVYPLLLTLACSYAQRLTAVEGGVTYFYSEILDDAGETVTTTFSTVLPRTTTTTTTTPAVETTPVVEETTPVVETTPPDAVVETTPTVDEATLPGQVGTAPCTATTCVAPPTTYTQDGIIRTFVPNTPTTPVPTWTASGQIVNINSYITSTGVGGASRSSGGVNWSLGVSLGTVLGVAMLGGGLFAM